MINKDTYKRLTERDKNNGKPFIPYKDYRTDKKINGYDDGFFDLLNRLAELEDKIENGTLIELPCKVDDTVYFIEERVDLKTWKRYFEIQEYTCWDITIDENGTCIHDGIRYYFGERAFTTKTEAEARLKELQGENK